MHIPQSDYELIAPPPILNPTPEGEQQQVHIGHAHFWERALSRRQVITSAAAGTAVVLGSGLLAPELALAWGAPVAPKPIPETLPGTPFHILDPGSEEPSSITDFNGFIGATEIQGTGTDGLLFDADMRFMKGIYVGVDGKVHHATFGFV
ncbi:MAG TPA: hypothetical protein VF510_15290 [Ktedonobacterales bacterium]|jgi:hypothetical protein